MAVIFEYVLVMMVGLIAMSIVNFSISLCLTSFTMAEDIICEFDSVNRYAIAKGNPMEILEKFKQLIQFHSDAIRLSSFLMPFQIYLKEKDRK